MGNEERSLACRGSDLVAQGPGARRGVFVDRDGTINLDVPYCSCPEDLVLLPGSAEAIRLLNNAGFPVVVVTNQSGIARGYFTEADLDRIHLRMKNLLGAYGARVDAIYCCPHHPNAGCPCRKPGTELALRAARELGLNLGSSFVIGDSEADIEMGRRVGARTVQIHQGEPAASARLSHCVVPDLYKAAEWVLAQPREEDKAGLSRVSPWEDRGWPEEVST